MKNPSLRVSPFDAIPMFSVLNKHQILEAKEKMMDECTNSKVLYLFRAVVKGHKNKFIITRPVKYSITEASPNCVGR